MSKKGCFNEKCISHKKQDKYKESYNFCPMCANEIIYVCGDSKCYKPLYNVRKKFCDDCLIARKEHKENKTQQVEKIAKVAGTVVGVVGTTVATIAKVKKSANKK